MKPFTEYLNDKLVEASKSVLSGHNLVEQNEPKPIKHSDVRAGDTVEWYNGPITFRKKVFEKDGKLYVAGTPGSRPILVSSIRLPLHLAQKSDDNAKAVRAAKREKELLKTREKSLADKRKRAGLTGGNPIKFVEESEIDKNFKMLMDYSSKLSQLIAMTGGISTPIGRLLIDELGADAKPKLASVRNKLVDAEEEFNALGAKYSEVTSMESVEESSMSQSSILDDLKKAGEAYQKQKKIFDKEEMELVKLGRAFERIKNDVLDNLSKDEMPDGLEDYLNTITIRTYVCVPSNQMYTP